MMKAQVAIEYMLIYVVVLAAIVMLLSSAYKMYESVKYAIAASSFKKDSQDLAAQINEVCNLGPYNSREATVNSIISIKQDGGKIEFRSGNLSYKTTFNCDDIKSDDELSGNLVIRRSDIQSPGGVALYERTIRVERK